MELRKPTRREMLIGMAAAPLAVVSGASLYAGYVEPYRYELSQNDFYIENLPPAFENFRIAQVSDVHHSKIVSLSEVEQVVATALAAKADMIVLTGDYTTAYRRYIEPCAEVLGRLTAPEGVWAVLGNHDHFTDPQLTTRALERNRISVINNANTVIRRGSETLQLAGIDDHSWGATNWVRAFKGLDTNAPSVLLSHQPNVLDYPQTASVSLILSGHTHGGQISLPWLGSPARFFDRNLKYIRGAYRRGRTQLFVTRGTGTIGLGVRLGARPEIAVIRLRRLG